MGIRTTHSLPISVRHLEAIRSMVEYLQDQERADFRNFVAENGADARHYHVYSDVVALRAWLNRIAPMVEGYSDAH